MTDQPSYMFTFERLQKRVDAVIEGNDDAEAWFMWNALAIVTVAPGYIHLTPEEVFEHLKAGVRPQQQETEDEKTFNICGTISSRCRGITTNRPCGRR